MMSKKSLHTKWSRFCPLDLILLAKTAHFSAVGMCLVKDFTIATDSGIAW